MTYLTNLYTKYEEKLMIILNIKLIRSYLLKLLMTF